MDILVADYDRHYAQWKWESRDSNGTKIWYAIPKDRDQALFYFDGALMRAVTFREIPYLKGFQHDIKNVNSLGFVARDVDETFLSELDRAAWQREVSRFQQSLTEPEIERAVRKLPPAVYAIRGSQTEETLKSRRDQLDEEGMEYYRFLARKVRVLGTNERDRFELTPADSGVTLSVFSEGKDTKTTSLRYRRTFLPAETRELRLYGLDGDDQFIVSPEADRRIRLHIVGGYGEDTFNVGGRARTWLYDNADEDNVVAQRTRSTVNMISHRHDANAFTFRESNYNSVRVPTVLAGFNVEDGILIGLGASITTSGFRVQPYKTKQRIAALVAPLQGAYQLRYGGEFNDAWRHYDVLVNGALVEPALQNFFGLGNETVRDAQKSPFFYRVRYSYAAGDVLARKRFLDGRLSVAVGPSIFHYWNREDRASGRVLAEPERYGLDRATIYRPLLYGGGRFQVVFNTLDNLLLPTRGARWTTDITAMNGLNDFSRPISRGVSDLELYAPLSENKRLVLTLRGGGGRVFSKHFEYFQAITLGANNALRGFRKSRFAGGSALYGSAELRARLAHFHSRLVPGDFGLIGFGDSGRVWLDGEKSNRWHRDWGGGVYYTPFNSILISLLMATSEEEKLVNLSVGAGVNFTF
jgi:hypothetical protein